jgi:hypothetical protein
VVQYDELFADVHLGGDRLVREVLRADQHDLGGDVVVAEQAPQGENIDGRLGGRGGDLPGVSLVVDHRE